VAYYDDNQAQEIINTVIDSQTVLSNLELGFHISNLEQKHNRKLENKELIDILPYKKSRQAISSAKKIYSIYSKYPTVINIFPVISMVGKETINKLDKIVDFAEKSLEMDKLKGFAESDAFNYKLENAILSAHDLIEFDAQKNKSLTTALEEFIGYENPKKKKTVTNKIMINNHVTMAIEDNDKNKRSLKTTLFEADLLDDERVYVERFLKVLTDKENDDTFDLNNHCESFFRRLEM